MVEIARRATAQTETPEFCAVAALLRTRGVLAHKKRGLRRVHGCHDGQKAKGSDARRARYLRHRGPARADLHPLRHRHLLQGHVLGRQGRRHQLAALARRDLGAAARRPRPGAAARQGRELARVPRDAPADAAAARAQGAAGPRARAGGAPLAGERDEGGVQRAERPPRRLLRRLPPRGRRLPRARVHGRGLAARRVRERRARGGARARAAARAHPLPDPAGAHLPPPRAPRRPPRPQAGEHPAQRRGLRQAL